MHQGKKVSLILPAYNEEPHIRRAVEDFKNTRIFDEILVIDNNSKDRTAEFAKQAGATVIRETKQGLGNAVHRGLAEATGEIVVLAEPDGTFVANDIHKFLAYADDFDVVIGTRTAKELIWSGANMGFFLRWGNVAVAKMLEFLFSGSCLTDCGCTFRLIRRSALERIKPFFSVGASHCLPEITILAFLSGSRVIEIPINYKERVGVSKITGSWKGTFKTGMNMIGLILWYRLRTLFCGLDFKTGK
ncbi:MAG: glycosyltransferase family 2 protein [Elusimicrobia bacterium]|nr:glycosyltransferase family 2 protein [Elusimicrobiota bacterium]